MHGDGRVRIELGNSRSSRLIARLTSVVGTEEELRGEVCDGNWSGIVEGQALDASQGDVLCDLDTEALESDNEHVGSAHALHGLMAKDIQLSAVKRLVDLATAHDGVVDLHPGDQVDLGELLVLLAWVACVSKRSMQRVRCRSRFGHTGDVGEGR